MSDTITLALLSVGQRGRVIGLDANAKEYRHKLLAMGMTPGTEFEVVRIAPLGDPLELSVRGYKLSLRKQEAAAIQIELVEVVKA